MDVSVRESVHYSRNYHFSSIMDLKGYSFTLKKDSKIIIVITIIIQPFAAIAATTKDST